MKSVLIAFAALFAAAPSFAADKPKSANVEYLNSERTQNGNRPFSEAVRVGDTLYLSGVIGMNPETGSLALGGIEGQTKQVLETIKTVLERNASSLDRVVKCTVMLADMSERAKMNAVYATFFKKHLPARSLMGVSGLTLDARVEIECIATVGDAG